MVHFFNSDKTDAYLNLVDSEILPEADVEVVNSPTTQLPTSNTTKSQKDASESKFSALRVIKVSLGILLLLTIVILSYSLHVQRRNLTLLKKHVGIFNGKVNATSLCDRSKAYNPTTYDEKNVLRGDNGAYCVDVCSHMKQISPLINGITVLTDPAKDGCWCKTNVSMSTRYQSCFIGNQSTEILKPSPTASSAAKYTCEFKLGTGSGGSRVKVGNFVGDACVKACLHFKQFDNLVNGVTVYSNLGRYGCWCEKRMRTKRKSINFKTCFLTPSFESTEKVDPNICAFSIGYGTGGTLLSMGKRSPKNCIEDCLHMKKIDRRINGVTIKSKDGTCWCDVAKTSITYTLKTCRFQPSDGKCILAETSSLGNEVKSITDVETWKKCSKECRGFRTCVFWTWMQANKTCSLKNGVTDHIYMKNAISGSSDCGRDTCMLTLGNGFGGSTYKIGQQTGEACISACHDMRFHAPSINGVIVYQDKKKSSCHCRSNMTRIDGIYKTCFLNPNITLTPLTTFHDYVPDCILQPGDGSGVGEIYLGKLNRDACKLSCLHLKKIDDTINGMTVYANSSRPGCWCEKSVRNVKKSKLFYSTCVFNFTHEAQEKINRHAASLCHFRHGYGAGRGEHASHRLTRAHLGRLNEDDCIEACAHLRRMDGSINGITRNTVTGRCLCDRNMASIGVSIFCDGSSDSVPMK